MDFHGETVWIIGASSGIGRELAVQLAQKGATVIVSARRKEKLQDLKRELAGEGHEAYPFDVSCAQQTQQACSDCVAKTGRLDRVIFMSAIYQPALIADMDIEFASKILDVNVKSVFALTKELLAIFEKQQRGQIVFCASVAGYLGLPGGQPYSATKAAMINFAESLYAESPEYINVKMISPGFVRTPMTDKNKFAMPMIVTPQQAAAAIVKGLHKKSFEIHFPKKFTLLVKAFSLLPYPIQFFFTKKMRPTE